jgi:hypothetical protein
MKLWTADDRFIAVVLVRVPPSPNFFFARFTLFITFLFFPDNFEVIKSVYLLQNVKKSELLRKTNYNFIKIDLNFSATLASPSFELATLGIESKTLNPTATEACIIKKLKIAYLCCKCSQKSQISLVTRLFNVLKLKLLTFRMFTLSCMYKRAQVIYKYVSIADLLWPGIWGSFESQLLISCSKAGSQCCQNSSHWMELRTIGSCLCISVYFGLCHRCHRVQIRCQWITSTNTLHARAKTHHS